MTIYSFTVTNVATGQSFPMTSHGATEAEARAKIGGGEGYTVGRGVAIADFVTVTA